MLVVLRGGRGLDGHCHRARGTRHHGDPDWVWRSCTCPYMAMIIVCAGCVTNCVTITTYHGGLPWILWDV
jgi:hypothetical protein